MATNNDYVSSTAQTTPICPMQYIYLATPDQYKSPDGKLAAPKYCVTLVLDAKIPEVAAYLKTLNELNDSIGQELIKGVIKDKKSFRIKDICKAEEDESGLETGRYFLKAATNALDLNGNPKALIVVDAQKKPMDKAALARCYSGTMGRVILSLKKSLDTNRKTAGLVLYLDKVQITEIVEGTNSAAGFTAVGKDTGDSAGAPSVDF